VNLFFSLSGATAFGRTRGNVLSVGDGHVGEAFYLRQLARSEQPGHPSIHLGPNIEWYKISCERPSNTSPSVFSPSPVSKIIEDIFFIDGHPRQLLPAARQVVTPTAQL
jgi:hypothetical protein